MQAVDEAAGAGFQAEGLREAVGRGQEDVGVVGGLILYAVINTVITACVIERDDLPVVGVGVGIAIGSCGGGQGGEVDDIGVVGCAFGAGALHIVICGDYSRFREVEGADRVCA